MMKAFGDTFTFETVFRNDGYDEPADTSEEKAGQPGRHDDLLDEFLDFMYKTLSYKREEVRYNHRLKENPMKWEALVELAHEWCWELDTVGFEVMWEAITEYRSGRWIWRSECDEEWREWIYWAAWIEEAMQEATGYANPQHAFHNGEAELSSLMEKFVAHKKNSEKFGGNEKLFFESWYLKMRKAFFKNNRWGFKWERD